MSGLARRDERVRALVDGLREIQLELCFEVGEGVGAGGSSDSTSRSEIRESFVFLYLEMIVMIDSIIEAAERGGLRV
jgi:hypothetical protein